jgi:hypothetical protein
MMPGAVAKHDVTMDVPTPRARHANRTGEWAAALARRRNIGLQEALAESWEICHW